MVRNSIIALVIVSLFACKLVTSYDSQESQPVDDICWAEDNCYHSMPTGTSGIILPPVYYEWWEEAERCVVNYSSGPARVYWQFVESIEGDPQAVGLWQYPHSITILEFYKNTKKVVQHEMIHDLLQMGNEAHGHPCFELPGG